VDVIQEHLGPSFSGLTLKRAIECITEHSKKGVLLLADELMKAEPTVLDSVKQIGVCLDELTPSLFNAVITTLNMKVTKGELLSGRNVLWIPLLPATYSNAKKLFQHVIDEEKRKPLSPNALHSIAGLEQCIADCNRHFRSLETLWRLWSWIKLQEPSYSELAQQLGREMDPKYSSLQLPHVHAALCGLPVQYGAKIPGLEQTYGECLEEGIFLNTVGNKALEVHQTTNQTTIVTKFVPWVSLQLFLFGINFIDNRDQIEYPYAKVILDMLDLEPNFTWQPCRTLFFIF
jgi:hypothetical protein